MCQTSFNMASLMKDDVNDGVPKGTIKTSDGVVNWDGVLNSSNKSQGDPAAHFEVGQKDLLHGVQFLNVHIQMIQMKGDL